MRSSEIDSGEDEDVTKKNEPVRERDDTNTVGFRVLQRVVEFSKEIPRPRQRVVPEKKYPEVEPKEGLLAAENGSYRYGKDK